jgi:hypothetical protein
MRCKVCGIEYGVSHECSGLAPGMTLEEAAAPPQGIAPGYYLRLAFRIASFDDIAIRRASRDPNALVFGALFSAIAAAIIFLVTSLPKMLTREGATEGTLFWGVLLGLLYVWVSLALIALIQVALCHAISKILLAGEGTFAGVLRASLLGWFVNCLTLIPGLGLIAALIAWTAVLLTVLRNVDNLSRSRAFLVTAGVNGAYYALLMMARHFEP